jgi:hypothetical protein
MMMMVVVMMMVMMITMIMMMMEVMMVVMITMMITMIMIMIMMMVVMMMFTQRYFITRGVTKSILCLDIRLTHRPGLTRHEWKDMKMANKMMIVMQVQKCYTKCLPSW